MVDKKELAEKSKTKFGKFTPTPQKPFIALLGKFARKSSPRSSFLSGMIWAGVLLFWFLKKDDFGFMASAPLIIWIVISVCLSVLGIIYWGAEKSRLDQDIARCEKEIAQIGQEISERKQYFEKIREEISKNKLN